MTDERKSAAHRVAQANSLAKTDQAQTATIRDLNDQFRRTLQGGSIVVTAWIHALGPARLQQLIEQVATFDQFTADNDPHGEHDFGAFEDQGERFFWKIDYYDPTLTVGSTDPADPTKTARVLTLMLADEY